jgi:anti-sigma regulatory factor (Ser/Thr protein kinase)
MAIDPEGAGEARATLRGFELTQPAVPETVTAFRHRAVLFAAERGAGPDLVHDVSLAVTEAATNAVKYAYPPGQVGTVELSASAEDGWLTLLIRDRGAGFGEGPSQGLGLGLMLIARVTDNFKIVQDGAGTQVLMRFVLP